MNLERHHIEENESILTVLCPEKHLPAAVTSVRHTRSILRTFIHTHRDFRTSLVPCPPAAGMPPLIIRMCEAGSAAGVGPMASVAGLVAGECLQALLQAGAPEAVVDNGGDMALKISSPRLIGIYCGPGFPDVLAFEAEPRDSAFAIATSSGTVGHSFSFGRCEAATVVSSDPVLADAAATALANRVSCERDLYRCFDPLEHLPGIEGALVVIKDKLSLWGQLPPLVKKEYDPGLITRSRTAVFSFKNNHPCMYHTSGPKGAVQ